MKTCQGTKNIIGCGKSKPATKDYFYITKPHGTPYLCGLCIECTRERRVKRYYQQQKERQTFVDDTRIKQPEHRNTVKNLTTMAWGKL